MDSIHLETLPTSRGATLLKKHNKKQRLTRGEALIAKCCECMGGYIDGRRDCKIPSCPLYPYMPYRGRELTTKTQ